MAEIVDSGAAIRQGSGADFDNVLTKNGATYPLNGKTVIARVRARYDFETVLDLSLEDIAVTPGGGSTTTANGGVFWHLSPAMCAFLTPPAAGALPDEEVDYVVQYEVPTDDYIVSELLRFGVTRGAA